MLKCTQSGLGRELVSTFVEGQGRYRADQALRGGGGGISSQRKRTTSVISTCVAIKSLSNDFLTNETSIIFNRTTNKKREREKKKIRDALN